MRFHLLLVSLLLWGLAPLDASARAPMLPADWTPLPRQSPEEPLRYRSPDGTASLSLFATPYDGRQPLAARPGERVTYKRTTSRFVAVSGYRGDRIFYRKSNVACRGSRWHHIVLEYDARDKRKMDALVTRIAHGMNRYDRDCGNSATTTSGGLVSAR
jgi:hypothetical protein